MKSVKPLNVAILMETSRSFGRGVIRGIAQYARIHGPWIFYVVPGDLHPHLPPAKTWDGDAVIGRVESDAVATEIVKRRLKVVCLGGNGFQKKRYIGTGGEALCRQAIDHLAERGFTQFAYFGAPASWSTSRAKIFVDLLEKRGLRGSVFSRKKEHAAATDQTLMRNIVSWLRGLKKPVGIVTGDDLSGRQIIDACAVANIHVPEQVAVVGIDNDELICELAHPSLSSVALNSERIGFESARILDGLMHGVTPDEWVEVAPSGVVARRSTEMLAIEDADVASAIRYIRDHAFEGVTVQQIVGQISVSRKTLEERFKRTLGRTPQVEIRRVQIERAKELLVRTDLKLAEVARKAGFSSVQYLHASFKKAIRQTPLEYRNANRASGI